MPTLLSPEAQGFTEEETPDIAAALGGAGSAIPKDVPQSDAAVIAERLLGPELADRYGDVLGTRKGRAGDFWRDFGNEYAGKGQAEAIKQRVIGQYQQKYRREQQEAQQKDQEDRLKITSLADLIRSVKGMPKGHAAGIIKAGLDKLGMSASPEVLKLFADPEKFDASELFSPEMMQMAEDDPQAFLEQSEAVLGDAQAALALQKGVRGVKQQKADTHRLILEDDRKKAGIEQTRALTEESRARTEQIKKGKAGKGGIADIYAEMGASGAPGAAPATPRTSRTPAKITVRKKEPAGISQPAE